MKHPPPWWGNETWFMRWLCGWSRHQAKFPEPELGTWRCTCGIYRAVWQNQRRPN